MTQHNISFLHRFWFSLVTAIHWHHTVPHSDTDSGTFLWQPYIDTTQYLIPTQILKLTCDSWTRTPHSFLVLVFCMRTLKGMLVPGTKPRFTSDMWPVTGPDLKHMAPTITSPTPSVGFCRGSARDGIIGLNKSTLIHRWHCDSSRALEVTYRHLFTLSHTAWNDYGRFTEWLIEPLPIFYAIY